MASLAELLDYDQRKKQALQALTDYASSQYKLGSAFGEGLSDQAKGIVQMVAHPWDTGTQMYEAGKAAVQNPKAALQAAKEGLTEAVSSPENISRFAGQNFNPLELANALKNVGTMREIVVHHGTPHRFEPTEANPLGEFNASKIGTGEGNQAYGHGIYMAEDPKVAETYIRVNPIDVEHIGRTFGLGELSRDAQIELRRNANIKEKTPVQAAYNAQLGNSELRKFDKQNIAQAIEKIRFDSEGSFYKADLPDEMVDRMLDWDKPLSEQSAHVQKAIENMKNDPNINFPSLKPEQTGQSLYTFLGKQDQAPAEFGGRKFIRNDKPTISDLLRQHGIGGIKYLDAGSRGQAGTGTRNFVVFPGEEKKIKILERK